MPGLCHLEKKNKKKNGHPKNEKVAFWSSFFNLVYEPDHCLLLRTQCGHSRYVVVLLYCLKALIIIHLTNLLYLYLSFPADLFHQLSQALEILTDAAARVSTKITMKVFSLIYIPTWLFLCSGCI